MLQTNLDTLLFCSNLLCRKLLQVPANGPWHLQKRIIQHLPSAVTGDREKVIPLIMPYPVKYFETRTPNFGRSYVSIDL
jgi:hypothetical protein